MYDNDRQKNFFFGALLGGTVATLATLLFTTKKGKQLRDKIGDLYEEAEGTVKDAFGQTKDKVEEAAEHAAKKIHHAKPH